MNASNAVSRKQQIYLEIFGLVLPFIRNTQTQPLVRRVGVGSLYPEAELVHNLAPLLLLSDFGKQDVWWLKAQGGQYIRAHRKNARPVGAEVVSRLEELELLMPASLRSEFDHKPDVSGLSFLKGKRRASGFDK